MNPGQKKITSLRHKQSLLYLMLFSLATVIIWVVISIFTSQQKSGISPELQKLAVPLTPTLNRDTLGKIEQKQFYSESELTRFPIYKIVTSPTGNEERVVSIDTDTSAVFPSQSSFSNPAATTSAQPTPSSTSNVTASPAPESTPTSEVPISTGSGVLN